MTGPEHYREAERILAERTATQGSRATLTLPECAALAQVHAILALAAATSVSSGIKE